MNIQEKWKRILMKTGLLLLLAVCTLAGCGKSVEQQIAEQLTLGQKYLEELDYEQAIVTFQGVIDTDPKAMGAYQGLAQAYIAVGDNEQAIAACDKMAELEPDNRDTYILRAECYVALAKEDPGHSLDNYSKAVADYETVLRLDEEKNGTENVKTELSKVYSDMAEIHKNSGDSEEALDNLNEAYDLSGNEEAKKQYEELSELYAMTEQKTAAEHAIEEKRLELQSEVGYLEQGEYTGAERKVSSAVTCDVDADGIEELLVVYISEGRDIWIELYDFQNDLLTLAAYQKIGEIGYCDKTNVRLFYSEQQSSFCIVTDMDSVWAYTGARETSSELYELFGGRVTLLKHWMMNSVENENDSPEGIIQEMQKAGIPYMDTFYFNYGLENRDSAQELILLKNEVIATGEDAATRTYRCIYSTYSELLTENGTEQFPVSEEQKEQIQSREQ